MLGIVNDMIEIGRTGAPRRAATERAAEVSVM
jgi:hypothetical protein